MNSFLLVLALLFSSLSPMIHADDKVKKTHSTSHQVIGRFVKPKASLGLPYKYYFIFSNSKGQKMAFPLVNKSSMDMKKIDFNEVYHINVRPTEKVVSVGEMKKEVKVLEMVDGKVFNLGDLGMAGKRLPMDPAPNIPAQNPAVPNTYTINDKIANTAIFTAGAVLLGSMLVGK